jgi:hypothetical protein
MKKVTLKKGFIMAEMYEDFRKMRVERKIDRLLDSLSELSYSMISGRSGSGAGSGIRGAGSAIGRGGSGSGAGTGIRGAGTPSRPPRSEDMDNEPEGNESFIEDNPPDEGKESISVSSRPYDHPLKAGSSLSIEQIFPGFMNGDFTDDNGIEKIGDKVHDDEQPAEEDNDQKLQNDINNVPNQNADELYDDVKDEMLGEMVDKVLEGLSGPGGKFGFEGEEGYKGKMGEDSNASEEK